MSAKEGERQTVGGQVLDAAGRLRPHVCLIPSRVRDGPTGRRAASSFNELDEGRRGQEDPMETCRVVAEAISRVLGATLTALDNAEESLAHCGSTASTSAAHAASTRICASSGEPVGASILRRAAT